MRHRLLSLDEMERYVGRPDREEVSSNRPQLDRAAALLKTLIAKELTPRQREYMMLYYGKNMSMEAIARQMGVNKSTVSRTLKRGRQRLYRCLRYGAANLLEQADS